MPLDGALAILDGALAALVLGAGAILALLAFLTYRRTRVAKVLWLAAGFLAIAATGLAWVLDPAAPSWSSLGARIALLIGLLLLYGAVIR